MVASFASFLVESEALLSGSIAMISQSGGLATMAQAMAQLKGHGFGLTVSSGNEAMLTVADYIHAAARDNGIKVIAAYVEGIRDGDRFVAAVSAARDAGKPVVVLKGGRTSASVQAVAAHTGALAGEQRVWEAVAAELGIISVGSLEELLDVALLLAGMDLSRLPKGKSVAIVTFGGGSGVISADQCAIRGLAVPRFAPETLARLAPLVPPIASIGNPVDLTPQTFNQERWFTSFPEALNAIAADPGIDIVFCQFGPQAQRGAETATAISRLRERTDKTVLVAWPLAPNGIPEILADEGVHVFQEYERAIAAIARIAEVSGTEPVTPSPGLTLDHFDWTRFVAAPRAATVISENECHRILAAAGVPVARGVLARSSEEAVEAARDIGFPLAAKGISASVTHRAAAGL
jgi:acetyltransferase